MFMLTKLFIIHCTYFLIRFYNIINFQLKECYMSICDWKPLIDWSLNEDNIVPSCTNDKYFWQNVRL